jgi:acetoin utilization deacetylase AcuC-like enzyme
MEIGVKIVYGRNHRGHSGAMELMFNRMVPMFDRPERMDKILGRLEDCGYREILEPDSFGLDPIHRVHDPGFVAFLKSAYNRWEEEVGDGRFATAYMFGMRGMKQRPGNSIHAMLSCYTFDVCVPFVAGTWEAIKSSVDTVLTAQALVQKGEACAFALCRPPGHHASQDLAGGYCYLNNAAIAAQAFLDQGASRIAILDVDYHHGNGTQRIFYERPDVLYISIHGSPEQDYPFLIGFADEHGAGGGEGYNINLPLPKRTAWPQYQAALDTGLKAAQRYEADVLIVSLGVDTYKEDPVSAFALESGDFTEIGRAIGEFGKPTLFVMEGGYALDGVGVNVVNVLTGFAQP